MNDRKKRQAEKRRRANSDKWSLAESLGNSGNLLNLAASRKTIDGRDIDGKQKRDTQVYSGENKENLLKQNKKYFRENSLYYAEFNPIVACGEFGGITIFDRNNSANYRILSYRKPDILPDGFGV